jgi:RNA polymerase sigma-70 factor (ECF subfamily)
LIAGPLYNEQQLLRQIANGNEAAFTRLFEYHRDRLYSIAIKLSNSSIIADEIVQDVFLKVWLKRNDLHLVQNFEAYLYTIVQNSVYKSLKGIARSYKKSLQSNGNIGTNADPEDCLIEKEYRVLLQKGIEALPTQQKQVYTLIREKGLKRAEVATLLNLQPETVKFHLSKAVKNLWSFCKFHLHTLIGITGLAAL